MGISVTALVLITKYQEEERLRLEAHIASARQQGVAAVTEVFGRPPTAPDWRTLRRVRIFIIVVRTDDEMNSNVGESQSSPQF